MRKEIELKLTGQTRLELRRNLVLKFLEEKPGKGTGDDASIYFYYVEKLQDGRRVYLKRPAQLNNGFDFGINVENTVFDNKLRKSMPSHANIIKDLTEKRKTNFSK